MDVSIIRREESDKRLEISWCHRLDDEVLVVREEEKATRFTLWFSSFEDHISVLLRSKWILDGCLIEPIEVSKLSEHIWSVLNNLHVFINDYDFLLFAVEHNWNIIRLLLCDEVRKLGDLPVIWVLDFNWIDNEFMFHLEIIFWVDWMCFSCNLSFRVLRDCFQDDMDEFHIERRSQESWKSIIHVRFRVFCFFYIHEDAEPFHDLFLDEELEIRFRDTNHCHDETCHHCSNDTHVVDHGTRRIRLFFCTVEEEIFSS